MAHLPEGTLRRLYDEPLAVTEKERAHVGSCPECQARFEPVAATARESMAMLAVPGITVDAQAALARIRPQLGPAVRPSRWRPRLFAGRPVRTWAPRLAAVGIAAALSVLLVGTGTADSLFTLFQPKSVQVVAIQTGDLAGLPDLSQFGDTHVLKSPQLKEATSAAEAASLSGLPVIAAGSLPASVDTKHVSYGTIPQSSGTFTFSAAKAQAYAASSGKTIPAMPAGMNGSTLTVTGGPAEFQLFGELSRGGAPTEGAGKVQLPTLAIGAMTPPSVTSTGVTVKDLKDYLKLLNPKLGPAIDAIGSKGDVLPIPIPVDKAEQTSVDIHGANGVALGDNTGLGSAVIWESKSGVLWAVAGTITREQALTIARSLPA